METTSYFHPFVASSTSFTILRGVRCGPDGTFGTARCPVASAFTCVPPMSTTRTFFTSASVGEWEAKGTHKHGPDRVARLGVARFAPAHREGQFAVMRPHLPDKEHPSEPRTSGERY